MHSASRAMMKAMRPAAACLLCHGCCFHRSLTLLLPLAQTVRPRPGAAGPSTGAGPSMAAAAPQPQPVVMSEYLVVSPAEVETKCARRRQPLAVEPGDWRP
jgi:hypothetical protein